MLKTETPVGNAVLGVPAAKGGHSVRYAGALHLRNAEDGVPYACILKHWTEDHPKRLGESGAAKKQKK